MRTLTTIQEYTMLNLTIGFFAGVGATCAFFFTLATIEDKKVQDARRADDFIAD